MHWVSATYKKERTGTTPEKRPKFKTKTKSMKITAIVPRMTSTKNTVSAVLASRTMQETFETKTYSPRWKHDVFEDENGFFKFVSQNPNHTIAIGDCRYCKRQRIYYGADIFCISTTVFATKNVHHLEEKGATLVEYPSRWSRSLRKAAAISSAILNIYYFML